MESAAECFLSTDRFPALGDHFSDLLDLFLLLSEPT